MLDLGWTELIVIAVVAVLVVGPKDLPGMLRSFGKTLGQLRRSANDFKRQFDDALREAEREAEFDDTRKQIQSATRIDPLTGLKKSVEADLGAANNGGGDKSDKSAAAENAAQTQAETPSSQAGKTASSEKPADEKKPGRKKSKAAKAARANTQAANGEAAEPAQASRDSDAA